MKWIGSPNYTNKLNQKKLVVIHIMSGSLSGTDAWFNNPISQVSSHYGVGKNGETHQYVEEDKIAWAQGRVLNPTSKLVKKYGGNPNDYCISIENEGNDLSKQPEIQIKTCANLVQDICTRNNIPIDRDHIIGHYEIYSAKPNCPATDKSIIDTIINTMNKKLQKAIENITHKDYGDNFSDSEQDSASDDLTKKYNNLIEERDVAIKAQISLNEQLKTCQNNHPEVIEKEVIKEVVKYVPDMSAVDLIREGIKKFLNIK